MNNLRFTFTSGAVFHSALANISTVLEFTDNEDNSTANDATIFELSSTRGRAMGTNRFSSCILTVETSTYAAGQGRKRTP